MVFLVILLKPPYPQAEASTSTDKNINNSVKEASKEKTPVQATANEKTSKENLQVPTKQEPSPQPVKPKPKQVVSAPTDNRAIGKQMAAAKGWTGDQWLCLEKLWTNESNWRHTVSNYQGSGAYGIAQSLPAHKMASHGADYLTNPRTQIAWGLDYIGSRYKTPCGALSFWNSKSPHWY